MFEAREPKIIHQGGTTQVGSYTITSPRKRREERYIEEWDSEVTVDQAIAILKAISNDGRGSWTVEADYSTEMMICSPWEEDNEDI